MLKWLYVSAVMAVTGTFFVHSVRIKHNENVYLRRPCWIFTSEQTIKVPPVNIERAELTRSHDTVTWPLGCYVLRDNTAIQLPHGIGIKWLSPAQKW